MGRVMWGSGVVRWVVWRVVKRGHLGIPTIRIFQSYVVIVHNFLIFISFESENVSKQIKINYSCPYITGQQ